MKKISKVIICFFVITLGFAQNTNDEIQKIQNYIQKTSQNEWFDPVNKNGKLPDGSSYDLAYYILPNDSVFSIIHTAFEKYTLQKVFYYKNNNLIACIVEETDANNANKLLRYADYFYKDGVILNKNDENKEIPSIYLYNEGVQKLHEALTK